MPRKSRPNALQDSLNAFSHAGMSVPKNQPDGELIF